MADYLCRLRRHVYKLIAWLWRSHVATCDLPDLIAESQACAAISGAGELLILWAFPACMKPFPLSPVQTSGAVPALADVSAVLGTCDG